MSARRCGICREVYRGKGSIVLVVQTGENKRACPTCTKRAILVAASEVTACKCGKPATTCSGCGNVVARKDAASSVEPILRMLAGLIRAAQIAHGDCEGGDIASELYGKIEGLEQARDRIKSGVWS